MSLEFSIWPTEAVGRLELLAERLQASGIHGRMRREVLSEVARTYEFGPGIDPVLLARYVDDRLPPDTDMPLAPFGITSAAIGSGTGDRPFAACVDRAGGLWASPIGAIGPVDWQPVDVTPVDLTAIAAVTSSSPEEGRHFREIFGITVDGRPWHAWQLDGAQWQDDAPENAWETQSDFPSNLVSLSAGTGGPNHVEVFVADTLGEVHHRWWSRWIDGDSRVWHQSWSDWSAMSWPGPDTQIRNLSFTTELEGHGPFRYHLFATDQTGRPWHREFHGEDGAWWLEPRLMPDPPDPLVDITGVCRTPGHLEVFAVTHDGRRWSTWSADRGASWAQWIAWSDDVQVLTQVDGATFDRDGRVAIHHQLAIDRAGGLSYTKYRETDGRWRGPFPVLPPDRVIRPRRTLAREQARRFGFDVEPSAIRTFETGLGKPKAILQTPNGEFFLGSLANSWPDPARLEVLLPLLNDVADSLHTAGARTRLPHYVPTSAGHWTITEQPWRLFMRTHLQGRPAQSSSDIEAVARAAAEFHGAATGHTNHATLQDHAPWNLDFELSTLERLADPDSFRAVEPYLRFIAAERTVAIDALPRTLTHNDLQPKNLLMDGELVWLIGLEGATSYTRLFDFYFFLMGDDHGVHLEDWSHFERAMNTYTSAAGSLSDQERHLLPSVMAIKAAGVAAWSIAEVRNAPPFQRGRLRDIHQLALRAITVIDDNRDRIRDIAE